MSGAVCSTRVDLAAHLLDLVAPAELGDEVVPGARLLGVSTELGLRLRLATEDGTVDIELTPAAEGVRHAARTSALLLGYRVEGGRVSSERGALLCRELAAVVARNEEAVLASIAAQATARREKEHHGARVREVAIRTLLEEAGPAHGRFYTLSPYVGCLIGCGFCYAQSRLAQLRRIARLPSAPWGSYVDVRVDAPEILRRELAHATPRPVKFCPIVSDPYQAVERRHRLTRRCLGVLRDHGAEFPVLVLTRSALIADDLELIASLPAPHVGVSIPTLDDEVRKHFEPRAASIDDRLRILEAFGSRGVRTFAVVQPLLPGPIDALADALSRCVESVSIDVLRGVQGAGEAFAEPRYASSRDDAWQLASAETLAATLTARGVKVWNGELPPELVVGIGDEPEGT